MRANPIAFIVLMCGLMSVAMGIYAHRRRNTTGALSFALLMFSFSVYSVGYSLELTSPNQVIMEFWNKIQYLGIVIYPTAYLIFTIQYTGHDYWLNRRRVILLFLIPFAVFLAKVFDNQWRLIYSSVAVDYSGYIPLLNFERGPLYPIIIAYQMFVVTSGNFLLMQKRRFGSALFRKQTRAILISVAIVYLTFGIYISDFVLIPGLKYLDWNPLAYTLWGSAMALAIFRYHLFDLAPIARETLIEMLHDGVIVLDTNLRVVDANPEALRIFGWGQPPFGKYASDVMGNVLDYSKLNTTNGSMVSETTMKVGSRERHFEVIGSCLKEKTGLYIGNLIVLHDISERKDIERKLVELTLVDELTGLTNRRGFKLLAAQLINMADRMQVNATLLFIDVDNLKQINDHFGHAEGDQALIFTAKILKSTYRSADIIARIGGDEFVILALNMAEDTKEAMLSRLEERMIIHHLENQKYKLSFSVGFSCYEWNNPRSFEALLHAADQSMYERKRVEKNTRPLTVDLEKISING